MNSLYRFVISIICVGLGIYFLFFQKSLIWSFLCFLIAYLLFPKNTGYSKHVSYHEYDNQADTNDRERNSSHYPKGINSKDFSDYVDDYSSRNKRIKEESRRGHSYDDDDEDDDDYY